MPAEDQPWLSVITVVKDAPDDFAATLESVALQDLSGVEYVVFDSSADPTPIEGALASLTGAPIRYSTGEPRGIYPAMNSALRTATGDYALFLNAGDTFHDSSVLSRVCAAVAAESPMWAFGRVEIVGRDSSRVVTPAWDYAAEKAADFSRGLFPPHQATLARRDALLDLGGFDARYSIVADYAMALRLSQVSDPLVLDVVVATFVEGGVSTTQWPQSLKEFHRARRSILRPRGTSAALEYYRTMRQAAAMAIYRGILSRRKP